MGEPALKAYLPWLSARRLRAVRGLRRSVLAAGQRAAPDPDRHRGLRRAGSRRPHARSSGSGDRLLRGHRHGRPCLRAVRAAAPAAGVAGRLRSLSRRAGALLQAARRASRRISPSRGELARRADARLRSRLPVEGRPPDDALQQRDDDRGEVAPQRRDVRAVGSGHRRDRPATAAAAACSRSARRCWRCSVCRRDATSTVRRCPGLPRRTCRAPTTSRSTRPPPRRRRRPQVDRDTLAKLKSLGYVGEGGPSSSQTAGATRTPGSYNNEGVILKEHGKAVPAIEAFERALALDPNLSSALWNLSDLLFARGSDLDRSDEMLVRALAHGLPEGPKLVIGRAIGYQRSGQADRSLALVNAALRAQPRRGGALAVSRPLSRRGAGLCRRGRRLREGGGAVAAARARVCVGRRRADVRGRRARRRPRLCALARARSQPAESP